MNKSDFHFSKVLPLFKGKSFRYFEFWSLFSKSQKIQIFSVPNKPEFTYEQCAKKILLTQFIWEILYKVYIKYNIKYKVCKKIFKN